MSDPAQLLQHAAWLRRLAYSLVRDEAGADELVQEAWVAALRSRPSAGTSPRPWLRRVVTNLARFHWRRDKNRVAREQALATVSETEAPSSVQLLERHETQQLLARLVGELEEPYRMTVLLRYAEGLSPAAIAGKLGLPAGTVRSRLHEALERLRVRLDGVHRGDRRAWLLALLPLARGPEVALPTMVLVAALLAGLLAVLTTVVWSIAHRGDNRPTTHFVPMFDKSLSERLPVLPDNAPGWMGQTGATSRHVAGIVLADGKPVEGALVRLTSDVARTGLTPILERRTFADGRFDFGLQLPRAISLGAAAPGMTAAVEHFDLRDPNAGLMPEAVELTLKPCVAGLYGKVTDAAGTPIANAELLREDVIGTKTDAAGSYDVCMRPVGISLEQLRLVVRAQGFGSMMLDAGPAGRERRDFVLMPEAVVEGSAHTTDGSPVANALVQIERADAQTRREAEQAARLIAATDAQGRFRFDGVAGGQYSIGAVGSGLRVADVVVSVAPGETRALDLVLTPSATVRGRVVRDGVPVAGARVGVAGVTGELARSQSDGTFVLDPVPVGDISFLASPYRVRSPGHISIGAAESREITIEVEPLARVTGVVRWRQSPVSGARVCMGREGGRNACTYADGVGRYVIDGLEVGDYFGFADDPFVGVAVHNLKLTLNSGEDCALDIELKEGARVTGFVVDGGGEAVDGALIKLTLPRTSGSRCVTDVRGSFECGSLAAGDYHVAVFGPGRSVPFPFVTAPPPVKLDGNTRLENIRLVVDSTRADIGGHVIDAAGSPVLDARIRAWVDGVSELQWFDAPPSVATDGDGRFRLVGLAPGKYALEVQTSDGIRTTFGGVAAGRVDLRLLVDRAACRNPQLTPTGDPLRTSIVPVEPEPIRTRPDQPIVWGNRVQLVGWDVPSRVEFDKPFELVLYYKVIAPIDQPWKVFVHFDGAVRAGQADHEPIAGRCQMTTWQPGQYVVDRFSARIEKRDHVPSGTYAIWIGFFTGFAPRWKNMAITDAPIAARDDAYNRVRIAAFTLL